MFPPPDNSRRHKKVSHKAYPAGQPQDTRMTAYWKNTNLSWKVVKHYSPHPPPSFWELIYWIPPTPTMPTWKQAPNISMRFKPQRKVPLLYSKTSPSMWVILCCKWDSLCLWYLCNMKWEELWVNTVGGSLCLLLNPRKQECRELREKSLPRVAGGLPGKKGPQEWLFSI